MKRHTQLMPSERFDKIIVLLRGEKVILDRQLAALYNVEVRVLLQAVKRNVGRFPADFMFQLSESEAVNLEEARVDLNTTIDEENQEVAILRSQSVISRSWGGRRTRPYAFTEQGVAMLSSVLQSPRAIAVNIEIMRAFVRLKKMLASNAELAQKIANLESKYDHNFRIVFDAIRELMAPPQTKRKPQIGFGRE